MGHITNEHLAKLWDFMASYNCKSEAIPSDILEAFLECDEALSDLANERDHWQVMGSISYQKIRDQEKEINQLRTENEDLKKQCESMQGLNLDIFTENEDLRKDNKALELVIKRNIDDATVDKNAIYQLRKENEGLKEQLKKDSGYLKNSRDAWRTRAKHAEKEVEDLNKRNEAQRHVIDGFVTKVDELIKDRDRKAEAVVKLAEKRDQLQEALDNIRAELEAKVKRMDEITKELVDTKIQLKFSKASNDDWQRRANNAGKQIDELKATLEKANADRTELQKDRDSYHELYTELSKTYDKLSEDNKKLKTRTDCLRVEVEWYRKHYRDQSDKIENLKKKLEYLASQNQKLTSENKRLQNNVRAGYDQGQTDLWVALQNVNDSQPFELATCFPDVTGMEDILNWDLEDFLDAYKKWQEEKEKERLDHMRDYLARFCEGRVCEACPLESNEYKCGCGYSFKKSADRDMRIIPDEELERYYEKARGCGACNLNDGKLFIHDLSHTMAGVNEAIKNAHERFTKSVEAANINISTLAWHGDATAEKIKIEPWSCTLEGTINVEFDRDMLEKVCGVKPDDK